jgi:ligand-binding sensor domain-containing protein
LRFNADGSLSRAVTRNDGLPSDDVRGLALGPAGELWIATGRGVSRLQDGQLTSYSEEQGLNDRRALTVGIDAGGTVYVGTERGVSRFDGVAFAPFNDTHEFSRRATYAIHVAGDGTIWFAKENALTHWLGGSEWEVFQRDPLLPGPRARMVSNVVRAVATDPHHRAWIGTREGLGHLDERGWRHVVYNERLFAGRGPRDNHVATVAVDGDGYVWVGHGDAKDFEGGIGVARFKGDDWQYFTVADGLPDNRVYRIRPGEDGSVWFATAGGVARFRDGRFHRYHQPGALPRDHVVGG